MMNNPANVDTLELIAEARTSLNEIQAEICKLEYLAKTNLPKVEYLQDKIADHARQLTAGLVGVARLKLTVDGVQEPPLHQYQ